jgi:hypothetical protein
VTAEDYSWLEAESTVLEPDDQVRAGEALGLVLEVGRDTVAGPSIANVTIQWAPYPDDDEGDYEAELYEVPDMHHSSLPHLEVLRDGDWYLVADLDEKAAREEEGEMPDKCRLAWYEDEAGKDVVGDEAGAVWWPATDDVEHECRQCQGSIPAGDEEWVCVAVAGETTDGERLWMHDACVEGVHIEDV